MKIAVLGAGNGGQALAGYLSLKGFPVALFNRSEERISYIKKKKGIQLCGLINEFVPVDTITTDMKEAVTGAGLIMVVVPAQAHKFIACKCAPYLSEGQIIVLNPGRTGGAMEFRNTLLQCGIKKRIYLAEAQTFLFVSRALDKTVRISGIKNSVPVAALPSCDTDKVVSVLHRVHESFEKANNVLETSLGNIGAIFHPSTMLFNIGRIESNREFSYYYEGITPQIARFLERVDKERQSIARKLKTNTFSACQWLKRAYSAQGDSLYELIQDNGKYRGVGSPTSLLHRYILEDIPTGLVPMSSIAHHLGILTPVIDHVVGICSQLYGTDFRKIGRTVDSLGLANKDRDEIIDYVSGVNA
jgi:opine dehydrogenase